MPGRRDQQGGRIVKRLLVAGAHLTPRGFAEVVGRTVLGPGVKLASGKVEPAILAARLLLNERTRYDFLRGRPRPNVDWTQDSLVEALQAAGSGSPPRLHRVPQNQLDALRMIESAGQALAGRAFEILTRMAADPQGDDMEIVREGRECWFGDERTSTKVLKQLLQACAVSHEQDSRPGLFERYRINQTGREIVSKRKDSK